MYRSTYSYTDPAGAKHIIPAGHPALPAVKAQLSLAKPIVALTVGVIASYLVGLAAAIISFNGVWVLFALCSLTIGWVMPKGIWPAISVVMVYHYGLSFPAIMLVIVPLILGMGIRLMGWTAKENAKTITQMLERHPLQGR